MRYVNQSAIVSVTDDRYVICVMLDKNKEIMYGLESKKLFEVGVENSKQQWSYSYIETSRKHNNPKKWLRNKVIYFFYFNK